MPKSLNDVFASKEKTDSLDARVEAISLLLVETLRTLQAKDIINADEIEEIFDRAAEHPSVDEDVESYINTAYNLLYSPDTDDESDDTDETELANENN